ncbi:Peroxisome chaperone and import receptor [Rhizina undulata]
MPPPPRPAVDDDLEDDLDELDDLLDEFNEPPPLPSPPPQTTRESTGNWPQQDAAPGMEPLDDEFARQLQMGMADLLSEMQGSKEFEHLVKELADATASPPPPPPPSAQSSKPAPAAAGPSSSGAGSTNFQDRIKKTMERMKSSEAEVDATIADAESDDFLAEMLKQMEGDSEEDFSKMLLNLMEHLTSKDILYEPMKELNQKYPEWLRNNESKQSKEEMDRYRDQHATVREIVAKFEESTYKDENDNDREYIIERMQKIQAAGAPPSELMGEMGQGLDLPPDLDSNCAVQ